MCKQRRQKGYIAFITALIISSFILTLLITFPAISTDSLRSYLAIKKGINAKTIAESCVEISLLKLQRDINYSGESLSVTPGSCIIEITNNGNSEKLIEVSANVDNYTRSLRIMVKTYGRSIGILSWEVL